MIRELAKQYAINKAAHHGKQAAGHWHGRGLTSKIEIAAGILIALIVGLVLAIALLPWLRLALVGVVVLIAALYLRKRFSANGSISSGGLGRTLGLFVLGALGLGLAVLILQRAGGSALILLVLIVAGFIARFIRNRRKAQQRRMLPNQRQVVKTAHSRGEADSEMEFRDFWEAVGAVADPDDPDSHQAPANGKDRLLTRKQISGVMIFERPDERSDVILETFLEGHEETDPAEELEHRITSVFADDISVYPVEEDAYLPFALADQWRASQGGDPEHDFDYDPDEIKNLAPPER